MRPDFVDLTRLQIYEIKPFTSLALAVAEMRDYITLMEGILKQSVFRPGSRYNPGATGVEPFTHKGNSGVLIWGCPVPGAILYQFLPKEEEPNAEQERAKLHAPGSQYAASVAAAAGVAIPVVIVGAGAMAAFGGYEALMGMLGSAVRSAGQVLPPSRAASRSWRPAGVTVIIMGRPSVSTVIRRSARHLLRFGGREEAPVEFAD
ncbi:hypothetical protein STRCI_008472 [Streptomyces cinnabarinus]|uniref:Uncharacterized protein n=1 Tax=Streptomyces cinnabarinus TaxID=67287 RepID=A0ABY7KVC7_9ACTN|nr:hypothetical protein [Streptomyces cinnabarinus]WAZ26824.1 hypothetical protein STRCI_008472 [Streptomyces cinnabarinus]